VPVLVGHVLRVCSDAADPGVVDDDVKAAEVADDAPEGGVDLLPARHVGRVEAGADAGLRELCRGRLAELGVELEHGDVRPSLGERPRDAAAETHAGARDDRDPALEHGHPGTIV
jgi:hypothetical protein